jgi:hypothetical protein
MATADRNGPALDQRVVVCQGAPATYLVPVADPDGSRPDLTNATAAWWVGPVPATRPSGPQFYIANTLDAFTKTLPVQGDGSGGFRVVLTINPEDLAGFPPAGLYQHEIWVTEIGKPAAPVTFGPLVIRGTVKGAAATG